MMAAIPFLAGTWFEPDWAVAVACLPQLTHPVAMAFVFCFVRVDCGFFFVVYRRQKVL